MTEPAQPPIGKLNPSDDLVAQLGKRLTRLENVAWVLGAVAVFLGIGGVSLREKLSEANVKADSVVALLAGKSAQLDRDLADRLRTGAAQLDSASGKLKEQIVALQKADPGWSVAYCVHQQSYGWRPWVHDGVVSGLTGNEKRVEAIRLVLFKRDQSAPSGNCSP